jgi:hypothetical protein
MRRRTALRSGTPWSPGPSTTSDAVAAASATSNPCPMRPATSRGSMRAAANAARKTSPAPVGSTEPALAIAG